MLTRQSGFKASVGEPWGQPSLHPLLCIISFGLSNYARRGVVIFCPVCRAEKPGPTKRRGLARVPQLAGSGASSDSPAHALDCCCGLLGIRPLKFLGFMPQCSVSLGGCPESPEWGVRYAVGGLCGHDITCWFPAVLPLRWTCCVTLGKYLPLSEPHLPHLNNEGGLRPPPMAALSIPPYHEL